MHAQAVAATYNTYEEVADFIEFVRTRFPGQFIISLIFRQDTNVSGTMKSWEAKLMPVGVHMGGISACGAAAAAASGGGAQAPRPFVAKRARPELPPQAPAPAAPAHAGAARAVSHPGKRVKKKGKRRARTDGDKRRRSPSSRKGSRARAELYRLAQKAKRDAAVPPPPSHPSGSVPTPPVPQPDRQGDLAAPLVTAAAREQRPSSTHGAAVGLTLDAVGATLLDGEGSGIDNLENDSLDADTMDSMDEF